MIMIDWSENSTIDTVCDPVAGLAVEVQLTVDVLVVVARMAQEHDRLHSLARQLPHRVHPQSPRPVRAHQRHHKRLLLTTQRIQSATENPISRSLCLWLFCRVDTYNPLKSY